MNPPIATTYGIDDEYLDVLGQLEELGIYLDPSSIEVYDESPAGWFAPRNAVPRLRGAARPRTHKAVEFAVDASGQQRTFRAFDEAVGFAASIAVSTGKRVHVDVLVHSRSGAAWWGGDDAAEQYDDDPDASVHERIEIQASSLGRVA